MKNYFCSMALVIVAFGMTTPAFSAGTLSPLGIRSSMISVPTPSASPVPYFGGPVLSHVKIHLVFWGPGVATELQQNLELFFKALVNSTYIDQLAEYSTHTQSIGRGSFEEQTTITPSNPSKALTQADMEKELEYQISSGGLPRPNADSLYMIYYPEGYSVTISFGPSCESWYADHEVYRSAKYGNVYYAMQPCSSFDMSQFSIMSRIRRRGYLSLRV